MLCKMNSMFHLMIENHVIDVEKRNIKGSSIENRIIKFFPTNFLPIATELVFPSLSSFFQYRKNSYNHLHYCLFIRYTLCDEMQ